jgi:hypothetical protein
LIVYIFWHWPERPEGYEEALLEFHRRLAGADIEGMLGNATYRVEGLPWIEAAGYEDWYLVGGFGDLEALNREAVGPSLRPFHDRSAAAAAAGSGALYATRLGQVDLAVDTVSWLNKPHAESYSRFTATLPEVVFVLRRQLALGPAPEFCLAGSVPGGIVSKRTRLWPAPS